MATYNISQKVQYKKFVTTFHDFIPICQLWKWLHCISM